MDFAILGPLEASAGGRKLPLGGVKQRSLLALLLLHANEVVSTDRLIDALWSDAAHRDGAKALSVAIARLRKTLAAGPEGDEGLLLTRPPGYELRLEPDRLDLYRFERLVAEGRPHDALALWRGPALADLAYESFAQAEIARLEERRLGALEERIDADLALGRATELVGELEQLSAEHPLRERLRGQLMLALYHSGRQADALAAYRVTRGALVEELGIEPGRRLRELHQAMLEQDPALEPAASAEHASQPAGDIFVGRGPELAELLAGLDDAFAGRGRLVLLEGPPGIGKSRLAEALAAQARGRGARVLVGRCWEAGGAPAYWPWTQSLRTYVRDCDAASLAAQLGADGPELAQIVPDLRERLPDLPPAPSLQPEGARVRLFDATARFLRRAAAEQPLVIGLDDLHAADAASLLLLRFLARELGSARVLLLGAYRDVDPVLGEPLTELRREVARESGTRRVLLSGLSEADVAEYVERASRESVSARQVSALHARTEGNPLFVGELVRLRAVDADAPVPQSIRDVIARRLTYLSADCTRMLVLASALGREFSFELVAALVGAQEEELLGLVEEAAEARLLSDAPGAPERLRFDHVLIRDTLYEGITGARRVRLHQRAVAALRQLAGDEPGPYLAELASHSVAAGDLTEGARYARAAAEYALEAGAPQEAARLYRLTLEALDRSGPVDAQDRCSLLAAAGHALAAAGSTTEAKSTFAAMADAARAAQLPEQLARAALGYGGSTGWARAAGDGQLELLLREALEALADRAPDLRARLLARLAGALRDDEALEPRSTISREAVAIARSLPGERETLAYALTSEFMATWGPDVEPLVPIAEEVTQLARQVAAPEAALDALTLRGLIAWLTFAETDAITLDDEFAALAARLHQPAQQWQSVMVDAVWALFHGDFEGAEQLAEAALRGGQARSADADCSYRLAMFVLRRDQGRLAEIEGLIREAVSAYPGYRSFRCFVPLLDFELGREQEARRGLAGLAVDEFASLPRDSEWLFCLALLAELAAALADEPAVGTLYRLLEPFPRVNAMASGEVAIGPVARYLGILAAADGRLDRAAAHFEEALAIDARIGARALLAHTQADYALALLARAGPGDEERAAGLLAASTTARRELGIRREPA